MVPFLDFSNYFYTFPAWPPLIVGACSLLLGVVILIREKASYASRTFACLCTSVAIWLLSIGSVYSSKDPEYALLMARVATAAIAFIPSTLLAFTIVIARQYGRWKWFSRLALIFSGFLSFAAFNGSRFLVKMTNYPWGPYPQYSKASAVVMVFFVLLYVACLWLLYHRTFGRDLLNINKDRDRQLWVAFSIGILAIVDFCACYGIEVYPIGYLPVYTSLLILAQTIWKYRFSALTAAFAAPHIIRTMPSGLIVTDSDGQIVIANDKSAEYLNRTVADLRQTTIQSILGNLFSPSEIHRLIQEDGLRDYEIAIKETTDGEPRIASFSAALMRREQDGPPAGFIFTIRDVTRRHKAEMEREKAQEALYRAYAEMETRVQQRTTALTEEIQKRELAEKALQALAVTDALTGLFNRRGFVTHAQRDLDRSRRQGRRFLLLIADLDNLKPLNDTFGHQTGDLVLTLTADLLRKTFRSTDVLARIGGDEFAIGVIESDDFTEEVLFSRFRAGLEALNAAGEAPTRVGVSLGIARMEPHHSLGLEELMAEADASLYRQKKLKPSITTPPAPDQAPQN